jgi:hypothetical protein
MATIAPTTDQRSPFTKRFTWTALGQADDGGAVSLFEYSDRTVQVTGTPGVGGTIVLEGSLEETPSTYFPITDHQGNPVSFTAAGGEILIENVAHVRPRVTAGDGTTAFNVILLARRTL